MKATKREHIIAGVWVTVTGLSVFLTWRAWEVAKRDEWELGKLQLSDYTHIAAAAAVRRERLRFVGQLVAHEMGIPFLFIEAEPKWRPINPWRALAPWGLIITHTVVLANTLLDFYDRRRALGLVMDLKPRKTLWQQLAMAWEDD